MPCLAGKFTQRSSLLHSLFFPQEIHIIVQIIIVVRAYAFFILELYLCCLTAFYHEAAGLDFVVFGGVLGVEDELVLAGLQ